MQPPAQYGGFEPYHVGIHGISSRIVASEPAFAERLPDIVRFIGDDIVCAHNARFDGSVLAAASIAVGHEPPDLRYLCTLTAARRCLELPAYRLAFVADALKVDPIRSTGPGSDALTVAAIVPLLADRMGVATLGEMATIVQTAPTPAGLRTVDSPHPDADKSHPLWGRTIVFTGALSSMTRPLAHEECVRVGASRRRRSRSGPTFSWSETLTQRGLSPATQPARRHRRRSSSGLKGRTSR